MVVRSRVNPLPVSEPRADSRYPAVDFSRLSRKRGLLDGNGKVKEGEGGKERAGKKQKLSANGTALSWKIPGDPGLQGGGRFAAASG